MPAVASSIMYFSASRPKSLTASFGSSDTSVVDEDMLRNDATRFARPGANASTPTLANNNKTIERRILMIACVLVLEGKAVTITLMGALMRFLIVDHRVSHQ